ncbi:MAG: hypothetical protein A2W34_06965 [Chloroflexi bacterium RBG_16_64_32]|nr:MAG: hypothetical protein A2W34_06965 [Chloroflexi bacterium RBG_16_64_32]
MRALGQHDTYARLVVSVVGGQSEARQRSYPLGAIVHDQFHQAQKSILAALAGLSEDGYELEDLSPGEQLPAGPETAAYIVVGGSHPRDYPNARISRVLDRALGAVSVRYSDWLSRVGVALPMLAQYEPLGGTMLDIVTAACIKGQARLRLGQGWRHEGEGQKLAMEIAGGEGAMLRAMAAAWEIVGVLAVAGDVLAAAEAAGAVDAKSLAWARARGYVPA